ncbi:MAG: hypothetical protein JWO98_5061 [Frankiales bacterium]|nr:hypothetical protein [Frankiales bacterium]
MPEWATFAVVTGGIAGALVGLSFVAVSIHARAIMRSAEVRCRAAQTVVDVGVVMGSELLALARVCAIATTSYVDGDH